MSLSIMFYHIILKISFSSYYSFFLHSLSNFQGMEDCHKMGFARNIGVSNFNSIQIQRIMDNAEVKIANLQV